VRFTTHFGLHFQAIRLQGGSYRRRRCPHRPCTFYGLWSQSRELRNRNSVGRALLHATGRAGATPGDSALGSSPFTRRYWGNHCYFLFLRL